METINLSIKGEPTHGYRAVGTFLQRRLQHDPPGFLWGWTCSGYNLWQLLKDKIILECFVSCSGKLCFPTTILKKISQPTLKHVQIKEKNLLRCSDHSKHN